METQNNELIDKLISGQNNQETSPVINQENEWQVLITTSRVVSIRYKIYVTILLVLIFFLVYDYLQPAYDSYLDTKSNLTRINDEINDFSNRKLQYHADTKLINTIDQQETQIISCLNYRIWCAQLDDSIKNNFGVARNYMQLNSLTSLKMTVDEKKILANINEYLIRGASTAPGKISTTKNWFINSISIGEPTLEYNILQSLPIRLNITFEDKDSLLSFINNVETNVLDNAEYRILYKLDEVSYDIVNYTTKQNVDVLLHAYYTM